MSIRCCQRRAYSLLEMLIVVSLLGVVMGLSATMLGTSFRMQGRATDRHEFNRSLQQFASRLRADAHAAESAELTGETDGISTMELRMPNGETIAYAATDGEIERSVRRQETIEHRDRYRLSGSAVRFELDGEPRKDSTGDLIVATISSKESPPGSKPIEHSTILAAVGLHQGSDGGAAGK